VTTTGGTGDDGTVSIAAQFRGPPESGNGGYACGLAAGPLHVDAAVVRLRVPPPLERPLRVERGDGSGSLVDGDVVVADARSADLDLESPPPVSYRAAVTARDRLDVDDYAAEHPFPTCFTCGPHRQRGDGLQIFPSPVEGRDGLVVSAWVPEAIFGHDDGTVRDEILWAALDCPSGLAWMFGDPPGDPAVLGELAVSIHLRPSVGDELVVAGWRLAADGRKRHAGSAVWTADGDLVAQGRAIWIVLAGEQTSTFNTATR
jgi:hypothetical protein